MIALEPLPAYEPSPTDVWTWSPPDENQLQLPLHSAGPAFAAPEDEPPVDELTRARIARLLRAVLEATTGRRGFDALDKHLTASTRRVLRSRQPLPVLRGATITTTHCTRVGRRFEVVALVAAPVANRTFAAAASMTTRHGELIVTAFEILLTPVDRRRGLPLYRSAEGPRTNLARR